MDNEFEKLENNEKEGNNFSKDERTTIEAKEGGWGYVACLGMVICFVSTPIYFFVLCYCEQHVTD